MSDAIFNKLLASIGIRNKEQVMEPGFYITVTTEHASGTESCDYLRDEDGDACVFDTKDEAIDELPEDAHMESDCMYTITTSNALVTYRIVQIC